MCLVFKWLGISLLVFFCPGDSTQHLAPVRNRDQFTLQTQNVLLLHKKYDKLLEYLNTTTDSMKGLFFTEVQGLSSGVTSGIITFPTPGKSVLVIKTTHYFILHLSAFCTIITTQHNTTQYNTTQCSNFCFKEGLSKSRTEHIINVPSSRTGCILGVFPLLNRVVNITGQRHIPVLSRLSHPLPEDFNFSMRDTIMYE